MEGLKMNLNGGHWLKKPDKKKKKKPEKHELPMLSGFSGRGRGAFSAEAVQSPGKHVTDFLFHRMQYGARQGNMRYIAVKTKRPLNRGTGLGGLMKHDLKIKS